MYKPRQSYTSRSYSRQRPISGFLAPESYPKKRQPAPAAPVVSTFDHQSKSSLSPKVKTPLKSVLLQKKFVYTLAAAVTVLGGIAGLINLNIGHQPTEQVKAFQAAIPSAPPKPAQVNFGLPERLKIPKINVDAPVEQVGITPEGDMDVPKDPNNAGWYERGPRPGEKGSSVIAAHYGWRGGEAAAFDNLGKLQKGDKVYVEDETGATVTFVVREIRSYDPNADASDVFGASDDKAHLNLITCQGAWDKTQESYSDRLVVFTDKKLQ